MKRNMGLVREILFFAEAKCDGAYAYSVTPDELPGFESEDQTTVTLHAQLMKERGLIKASFNRGGEAHISSITWEGYEFIDDARDPKVWDATIKAAGSLSWGVFTSVLNSAAVDHAKSLLHSAKVLLVGGS